MDEKSEKLFPKSRVTRMVKRALEIGERKGMNRFNIPLIQLSPGGWIEHVNRKATASFSIPEHELVGRHITDLLQPDPGDHESILADVAKAVKEAEPGKMVALPPTLVMRKDPNGEPIESIARFSVYRPVKGEPKVYVSMTHTRRVLEKSKLLKEFFGLADTVNSERDLDKVLQGVADHFATQFNSAAIVVKPNGGNKLKLAAFAGKGILPADFLKFNDIPSGSGLIGQAAESLMPREEQNLREWSDSFNPELDEKYNFRHSIAMPLTVKGADGKPVLVGVIGLFKGGVHANETFRPHERRMFEVLAGNTATAIHNAKLTRDLRFMAERDEKTGLYNRRVLFQRMRDYLNAGPPGSKEFVPELEHKRFTTFLIDADNLKLLNDLHSYADGDRGLKVVADAIKKHAPKGTTIARIGGDEFVVFMPEVDMPASDAYVKAVGDEITKHVSADEKMKAVNFGASISYTHFGAGGRTEGKYHNLYDLTKKYGKTSAEEHAVLNSLLELPEAGMKELKQARSQLHVFVPRLLDDLAARAASKEITPEQEEAVLKMVAAHAGSFVHGEYASAKKRLRGKQVALPRI